jgi:ketosteroid isomerase-like protein
METPMYRDYIRTPACLFICFFCFFPPALPAAASEVSEQHQRLESSLRATEAAFAKTMADRDRAAFARFLGTTSVARGSDAVAAAWAGFFEDEAAPFSWEPESAAVLDSGTLGVTSGPVYNPAGERIGTFNSVWRREANGTWRIVFDRGCPPCNCP